jgi:hypothetical protein
VVLAYCPRIRQHVTCVVVAGRGIYLFSWLVIFCVVRLVASCLAVSFFLCVRLLILLCSGEWASVPV